MDSVYFLEYVMVNPYTGGEEKWDLRVRYIFHPPVEDDPQDMPYGELLAIEDSVSSLPIERAIPYWTEQNEAEVNQRLQQALTSPFTYNTE